MLTLSALHSVLGDILADVRRITTYRPMARFLHRDEIARSITQRGADINQALDMFQVRDHLFRPASYTQTRI